MKTERQIELLKRRIQELTTENQVLREINVKLQIENFNLQKKLESRPIEEELIDDPLEKLDTSEHDKSNFYEVVYTGNDSTNDAECEEEEYLEQMDDSVYEVHEDVLNTEDMMEHIPLKRKYLKVFDEPEEKLLKTPKENIGFQITILENDTDETFLEAAELDNDQMSPKDAMRYVHQLAGRCAILEKLKSIEKGKNRDSTFINKILDLLFDRVTLSNSTAHGQKCQSKLHLPAKPPLDQHKMNICHKAFLYRIQQDNIDENEVQLRMKSFNKLVNDKIQNSRKCLSRTDIPKLLEV